MAYTTIPNLETEDPKSGEIEKGSGYYVDDHTFFYWQDIEQVIRQSPNAPMSNLQRVNIHFERTDGSKNHDRKFITGLALRKTKEEIDALNGSFDNTDEEGTQSKWYPKVALAWPVYYKGGTTDILDFDNDVQEHNGLPFQGSADYVPGELLEKTKRSPQNGE